MALNGCDIATLAKLLNMEITDVLSMSWVEARGGIEPPNKGFADLYRGIENTPKTGVELESGEIRSKNGPPESLFAVLGPEGLTTCTDETDFTIYLDREDAEIALGDEAANTGLADDEFRIVEYRAVDPKADFMQKLVDFFTNT